MKGKQFRVMNIFLIISILSTSIIAISSCCNKEEPYDFKAANNINLDIFFLGSKTYVFDIYNSNANVDSFQILDMQGDNVPYRKLKQNLHYSFTFDNFYNKDVDTDPFQETVCKNYLLYYNFENIDTLKMCFLGNYTDCTSEIKDFYATYNSRKINSSFGGSDATIEAER